MSKIEWTDEVWNPVTGCTKVSDGCRNCYAERMHARLHSMGQRKYKKPFSTVVCHPDDLEIPLRWRKPRMVFVNSMSDLFHPDVPFEFIAKVFDVMCSGMVLSCKKCKDGTDKFHEQDEMCFRELPVHTYQILTKRPERISEFICWISENWDGDSPLSVTMDVAGNFGENVWLGVSVEDQKTAEERIPVLLEIPAAKRFVSCEPLLGPILLPYYLNNYTTSQCSFIHWVIVGGESGPKARPMHPDWVRALRDQCTQADVPFFFKQWGGKNKKAAGNLLDGKKWEQIPERC